MWDMFSKPQQYNYCEELKTAICTNERERWNQMLGFKGDTLWIRAIILTEGTIVESRHSHLYLPSLTLPFPALFYIHFFSFKAFLHTSLGWDQEEGARDGHFPSSLSSWRLMWLSPGFRRLEVSHSALTLVLPALGQDIKLWFIYTFEGVDLLLSSMDLKGSYFKTPVGYMRWP